MLLIFFFKRPTHYFPPSFFSVGLPTNCEHSGVEKKCFRHLNITHLSNRPIYSDKIRQICYTSKFRRGEEGEKKNLIGSCFYSQVWSRLQIGFRCYERKTLIGF